MLPPYNLNDKSMLFTIAAVKLERYSGSSKKAFLNKISITACSAFLKYFPILKIVINCLIETTTSNLLSWINFLIKL